MHALEAFVHLLQLLREPLLIADLEGEIVAANIAGAEALATSIAALNGANLASFTPGTTRVNAGESVPLQARDGRHYVCDASALASGLLLLRISGGPEAEPRARSFFEALSRLDGGDTQRQSASQLALLYA